MSDKPAVSHDVGEADFDAAVIERSHEIPVLVDFWAPWCGPCRMLGPVLEELASSMQGRFELVKVNTDASPGLGTRYRVRSIPAVKLFHRGQVIAEFVGAQPGATIRRLLETHLPSGSDRAVEDALAHMAHDPDGAKARLLAVLDTDATHVGARVALARLALRDADADEIERLLDEIDPTAPEADVANRLREAAGLARTCAEVGGLAQARARVDAAPDDLDARYAWGCCLAVAGQWADALAQLLEVVKRKASHRDRAAVKAMVTIFGLMPHDDVRDDYQRQLQIYA